jgi:hypothetical protein
MDVSRNIVGRSRWLVHRLLDVNQKTRGLETAPMILNIERRWCAVAGVGSRMTILVCCNFACEASVP